MILLFFSCIMSKETNEDSSNTEIVHIIPEESTLSTIKTDIQCTISGCHRTFKSMSVLRFHESQFHRHERIRKTMKKDPHIEQRFHCPIKDCIYYFSSYTVSKYFAKLQYLKQHYLKVHGECSFPCDRCHKSFSTKSYLRAHQMYCDLDIVCSCEQKFVSITGLQTHVKRTRHKAEVLDVYASRIEEKKVRKLETSKLGQVLENRVPRVDVGVQTEAPASRRLSRKCLSPIRSREAQNLKRKQTTEMETQTQLTNLKSKVRKRGGGRRISKCNIATDTGALVLRNDESLPEFNPQIDHPSENPALKCDIGLECNYNIFNSKDCIELCGNMNEKELEQNFNSSSTQTSSVGIGVFVPEESCLSYELFRGESRSKECQDQSLQTSFTILENSNEFQNCQSFNNVTSEADCSDKSQQNDSIVVNKDDDFDSSILDDDNLVSISPSGRLSPLLSHIRPPSLSAQNRSSSIETQTDCDVFLSNHTQPLDEDGYDIILTSSETQTCENFSDIEPFLCSTIHTQTVDEHHSSSELFPELQFIHVRYARPKRESMIYQVLLLHILKHQFLGCQVFKNVRLASVYSILYIYIFNL
ncbi:ATM interactor [Armadillidium vulgare]|nr:ATM interactor [Armadillidium vulgare]